MNDTPLPSLLDVNHLVRRFSRKHGKGVLTAVDDVSFELPADKPTIVTIAGESGSGKSTLASMLLGFLKPSSGTITFNQSDVTGLDPKGKADFRQQVQAVFQDPFDAFNPFYSVEHVLYVAAKKFGLAKDIDVSELIKQSLLSVRLQPENTLGRYPHQLSGGQLQRIMIARALMIRPRLIIADEPVSMIDASLRAIVLDIMAGLRDDHGISQVYITHDLSSALQISDKILILYRGVVVESGNAADVIGAPQHPYTQLLISSIPVPDPGKKWEGRLDRQQSAEIASGDEPGCKFADRCPHAMTVCRLQRPSDYEVGPGRKAACFLYDPQVDRSGRDRSTN